MKRWKSLERQCLFILFLLTGCLFAQQTTVEEEEEYRFAIELENKALFDLAALQLHRLAEKYPQSIRTPEVLFRAGQNYERCDSLYKASQVFLSLLLKYPESALVDAAQFSRAKLLGKNKQHLDAAYAFDRVKILSPKSTMIPEAQIQAAQHYFLVNEFQKSLDAAYYVLENYKTHPLRLQAYFQMSQAQEALQDFAAALESLDRIIGEKIEDEFAASVYVGKARLLRRIGRFSQADSVLQILVKGNFAGAIVAAAAEQLAGDMLARKQYDACSQLLTTITPKIDEKGKAVILLLQADLLIQRQQWAEALSLLRQIDPDHPRIDKTSFSFRQAMVKKQLNDFSGAAELYKSIMADSTADQTVRHYALLDQVDMLVAQGRAGDGLRLLQDGLRLDPTSRQRIEILFKAAGIQETVLNDFYGARMNYSAVMAEAPFGKMADDAQFRIGVCYEKAEQMDDALAVYERYLHYYPGGDDDLMCRQKLSLYRLFSAALDSQSSESDEFAAATEASLAYRMALLDLSAWKHFRRAYAFLQKALQQDDGSIDRETLYYLSALCLLAQAQQQLSSQLDPSQLFQELIQIEEQMKSEFPESRKLQQVLVQHLDAQINALPTVEQKQFILTELNNIGTQTDIERRSTLAFHLAELVNEADSTMIAASQQVEELIRLKPNEDIYSRALFLQAKMLRHQAKADSAVKLLYELHSRRSPAWQIEGTLMLAELLEEKGELIDAQRFYAEIADQFTYSRFADQARYHVVLLMLKQGQYREAEIRLKSEEKAPVPPEFKRFYPLSQGSESLWLWAELARKTRSPQEVITAMLDYLSGGQVEHRDEALFAIAEAAEQLNQQEMALGYYEEVTSSAVIDTLSQRALLRTAEIYFNRGMYEQARDRYGEIINRLFSADHKKEAKKYQIVCEYRLGNTGRAAALEKEFNKEFNDRNAEARFLYEAGLAFMSDKNFESAEKAFKTTSSKYDDVPEGARGNLGLAQLYVIQNKTEDALDRLIQITEKYTDAEMVSTALLNLANFYYQNRQIENAIASASKILNLQEKGPLRAQAMDILINAYDDINLRDKAIALEREYIQLYPNEKDLLNRRIRIGIFLYGLKEYDRAISHLKSLKSLVSAENEAEVQYWIARSYADAGLTEQAVIEFLKVRYQCKPTKLPWGVTALYEAGQGYRKLGNLKKAREMFQDVVRERGATDNIGRAANSKIQEIDAELKQPS